MIIKSHIRAGYRAAADYLKDQGQNELTRLVEISDPDAKDLGEAFHNMWAVASNTRAKKPLHHISINPFKDERLTNEQVLKIVERCEQKYGYKPGDHQRVIVEHIKDGRQHFHVIWCRVNLTTGKAVWPGHHWNKSKQSAREMERELGLKRPLPRRTKRMLGVLANTGRIRRSSGRYQMLNPTTADQRIPRHVAILHTRPMSALHPTYKPTLKQPRKRRKDENIPNSEKMTFRRPEWESMELLAWAWENGRADILAEFGIYVDFEP